MAKWIRSRSWPVCKNHQACFRPTLPNRSGPDPIESGVLTGRRTLLSLARCHTKTPRALTRPGTSSGSGRVRRGVSRTRSSVLDALTCVHQLHMVNAAHAHTPSPGTQPQGCQKTASGRLLDGRSWTRKVTAEVQTATVQLDLETRQILSMVRLLLLLLKIYFIVLYCCCCLFVLVCVECE